MKKRYSLILAAVLAAVIAGCSSSEEHLSSVSQERLSSAGSELSSPIPSSASGSAESGPAGTAVTFTDGLGRSLTGSAGRFFFGCAGGGLAGRSCFGGLLLVFRDDERRRDADAHGQRQRTEDQPYDEPSAAGHAWWSRLAR